MIPCHLPVRSNADLFLDENERLVFAYIKVHRKLEGDVERIIPIKNLDIEQNYIRALVFVAPRNYHPEFDRELIEGVTAMLKEKGRQAILCEYHLPENFRAFHRTTARRDFILDALRIALYPELWVYGERITPEFREVIHAAYIGRVVLSDRTLEGSVANRYINMFWSAGRTQARESA